MLKVILVLPTNNEVVEVFERILMGGFSCVNTRLVFDTEILMPNISRTEFDKMTIDENVQAFKRLGLKVRYKLKLDGEKTYTEKSVIQKILKLDENNQYSYTITKSRPTGCIKSRKRFLHGKNLTCYSSLYVWKTKLVIYLWSKRQHPSN